MHPEAHVNQCRSHTSGVICATYIWHRLLPAEPHSAPIKFPNDLQGKPCVECLAEMKISWEIAILPLGVSSEP